MRKKDAERRETTVHLVHKLLMRKTEVSVIDLQSRFPDRRYGDLHSALTHLYNHGVAGWLLKRLRGKRRVIRVFFLIDDPHDTRKFTIHERAIEREPRKRRSQKDWRKAAR